MNILAIDPGKSGGFAWTHSDGGERSMSMPDTEGDTLQWLRSIHAANKINIAYIEEVGGYCGVGMPGSAMFKFGRGFGFLIGVLMTLGIRVELVKPQVWQKSFGFGTVKSSGGKAEWKRKLKAEAQRRFPHLAVTLNTADALLIYDYARNKHTT